MKFRQFSRRLLSLLGLGGLFVAQSLSLAGPSTVETSLEDLLTLQTQIQSVQERTRKALVAIECGGGTASGVIVSPNGLVFTAAHVTGEPNRKVKVILSDGRTVEGTSLGLDTATDSAMIQLPAPAKAWPYVSISRETREVKVGDWCYALGHPGGWDVARGPVLRIGRIVKVAANMLQSDCVLMGGDSGGALFNPQGDVIGIHSQIWQGRDQNLHVSMAPFLRAWEVMKKGQVITAWAQGSGGWIGLSTEAAEGGLSIRAIAPDSPAMKAGLKEGDVIMSVNNEKLAAPVDFSQAIRNRTAGQLITLKIRSPHGERFVEVKLGQRPEQ